MKIKALTLWQPWATLMAMGEKKIETRSWGTNYRGLLAIHSAKRKLGYNERELIGHANMELGINIDYKIPFGKVVCVVNLVDCTMTTTPYPGETPQYCDNYSNYAAKHEYLFGNYTMGRWAWKTEMVWNSPYVNGYPAKGHQRIWNWEVHGYIQGILENWMEKNK